MADIVKKVAAERAELLDNNKGVTESSRVALSAISGRNVLKTKAEVAKMKRDREIAAGQVQAAIAQNDAAGAVTMAKAQTSAEAQLDRTRRDETLSLINIGIYEDSFAKELGMPAAVVKQFADKKASEINAAKAAKAQAAQAQAEYEETLEEIKRRQVVKISGFDLKKKAETSEGAMQMALDSMKDPEKMTTPHLLLQRYTEPAREAILQGSAARSAAEVAAQAAQRYNDILSKKVAAKISSEQELDGFEVHYKDSMEGKLALARLGFEQAETYDDKVQKYQDYISTLDAAYASSYSAATAALLGVNEKVENVEEISKEERSLLDESIVDLKDVRAVLQKELETEDLSVDFQDTVNEAIENIDLLLEGVEAAVYYEENYGELKDWLYFDLLERKYGYLRPDELDSMIAQLEEGLAELVVDHDGTAGGLNEVKKSELYKDTEKMVNDLVKYREQKTQDADYEILVNNVMPWYEGYEHMHITESTSRILEMLYDEKRREKNDYIDIMTGLDQNSEEGQNAIREEAENQRQIESDSPYSDAARDITTYYVREVVGYNENYFSDEELERYAVEQADILRKEMPEEVSGAYVRGEAIGSEIVSAAETSQKMYARDGSERFLDLLFKYQNGRGEIFNGDYTDFAYDVAAFANGEYGSFTKEEGQLVLALMNQVGDDAAFDYYAAVREIVMHRRAEERPGVIRTVAGLVSGPVRFLTNGGQMLENALTGSYARIGSDIFSASHQVTMEKIQELGFGQEAVELLYMSGYSFMDMLPQVALSMVPGVGKYAAAGYMFSKVLATTYTDSVAQGKRADEALTFGFLSATSEVAMQKILGGVSQLAGKGSLQQVLHSGIEKLAAAEGTKKALKWMVSMGLEGVEEGLQEVVSPFLEKMAADLNGIDADLEEIDWEEAGKSFLIGAIMGGAFDGINMLSSNKSAGIKYADAAMSIVTGDVADTIAKAAKLGSKKAQKVMEAFNNESPIYPDREGWSAYVSPHDVVRIKQSVKRKAARNTMNMVNDLIAKTDMDRATAERTYKLMKKVVYGKSLTVEEAAEILADERMVKVFNELLGRDVAMMQPGELAVLARLAAFTEDGKISKARMKLFEDTFGQLDAKALEEVIRFSDIAANKMSGIVFDGEEQTFEGDAAEAADVLKILSEETGIVFYITEQFETGTHLAANLMAVKPGELNRGVFNTIGHRVYYMTKQLLAEKGVDLKELLLEEARRINGVEMVEAEVERIQRQEAVEGWEIKPEVAEDEVCARMMAALMLNGRSLERLAEVNEDAANALRRSLLAVRNHLIKQTEAWDDVLFEDGKTVLTINDSNEEFTKTLVPYSKRAIIALKNNQNNVIATNKSDVVGFVDEAFEVTGSKKELHLGEITRTLIDRIYTEVTNLPQSLRGELFDLNRDYSLKIGQDEIRHMVKEKKYITKEDVIEYILNLPMIMNHFDVVDYTIYPRNKAKALLFRKQLSNGGYFALELVSKKKSGFRTHTIYMDGVDYKTKKKATKSMPMPNGPRRTSKTMDGSPSNDSIFESDKKVNKKFNKEIVDYLWDKGNNVIERLETLIKKKRRESLGYGTRSSESFDVDAYEDHDFGYATAEQVRAENAGADYASNFEDLSPEERDAEARNMQTEIDALLRRVDPDDPTGDDTRRDTIHMVGAQKDRSKKTVLQTVADTWNHYRRKIVDAGATVYDIASRVGDFSLYHYFDAARSGIQAATFMIEQEQRSLAGERVGDGLAKIWEPIHKKGKHYADSFDNYLLHLHNIDRMSRRNLDRIEEARTEYQVIKEYLDDELKRFSDEELRGIARDPEDIYQEPAKEYVDALDRYTRLNSIQNKLVFDRYVDPEESRTIAARIEQEHPEFVEYREAVYRYRDNLMQYRVECGLVSPETAKMLAEIYPHYVPTARVQGEGVAKQHHRDLVRDREQIGKTVGRAIGGTSEIIELYQQFADQTMSVVQEGRKNLFGAKLLDLALSGQVKQVKEQRKWEDLNIDLEAFESKIEDVDPFAKVENKNVFGVFFDGHYWEMDVTDDLFEAVKALENEKAEESAVMKLGKAHVNLFKKLCTSMSLKLMLNNPIRDFADAMFTSKDTKAWAISLPKAIKEMKTNGELWRQYSAMGGGYSTIFDFDTMRPSQRGPVWRNTVGRIEALNQAIEQLPRFAEFIATIKKGDGGIDNVMEAMYNAADITTNFGRMGTWGKNINRYIIPFFNPAVQGASKAVRMLTEQKSFKGFVSLGLKAVFFGIAPAVLNSLLYSDDEEWEQIRQSDKDRYFLFKVKDGLWLRIPKGRMVSVIGAAGNRFVDAVEGDEVEWASFIGTAMDQVAPSNPLTSNIFGPLILASVNRTWYGTDIVNQRLSQLPDAEQYDAKTDEISKWLGSITGLSPKKINYVLDSYSGVIGDILLPMLTPAAERNFLEQGFTLDSNYSNRLSEDFYDKMDELSDTKNSKSGTPADVALYRWWNRNASEISEVNEAIREIEEVKEMSGEDKREEINAQYAIRNTLMLGFEEYFDQYAKAVGKYADRSKGMKEEDAAEFIYREANREVFGAEYALEAYNKATYERAVREKDERGIDFDTFYEVYFDEGEPDVDKCFSLIEEGFTTETALIVARKIGSLEPEDGKKSVSAVQKYKAINEADVTEAEKMQAMAVLGEETDVRRLTVSVDYKIPLAKYIEVKENLSLLNKENTGTSGISNAKVAASINAVEGLTDKQKAVLWQLFTGATSAKNNPYSVSVGWSVVEKNKALKEKNED